MGIYGSDNLDSLPLDLTMDQAKTQYVDENKGIAFQGHQSPLSNFYQCRVHYKDEIYGSVEQGITHQAAKNCNMLNTARVVMATQCPYELKRIARDIPVTPLWGQQKDKILYSLMKNKFVQNEDLKQRLLDTRELKLYEATKDLKYGCRYSLREKKHIGPNMKGKNLAGENLMKISNELKN